jgi:hypothetical protein
LCIVLKSGCISSRAIINPDIYDTVKENFEYLLSI